jgi:lipopolysaccharide/colanic/teichoic acid biosynthesis glycosyltransferase
MFSKIEKKDSKLVSHNSDETILGEQRFGEFLEIERKRSERSGKIFVLMLIKINLSSFKQKNYSEELYKIFENIIIIIKDNLRATDTIGWYKNKRIMGIILTETESKYLVFIKDKIASLTDIAIQNKKNIFQIETIEYPCKNYKNDITSINEFYRLLKTVFEKKKYRYLKRMIDITGSLFGFLFFLPFFIVIPVIIKIDSAGPVFFKQKRIGQKGKTFLLYKFRSMYQGNSDNVHKEYVKKLIKGEIVESDGVYKIKNDNRITNFGQFLRKTSLDELPQFINVIKGEMSLVGPRPPISYEIEAYDVWHLRRITECKPGITGIWQVYGRSVTSFEEMVRMDLAYVKGCSLLFDLKLLIKTPWVLLKARGAY